MRDGKYEWLIRAYEEGRVIVAPFKLPRPGDAVYRINEDGKVEKIKITAFDGRKYMAKCASSQDRFEFTPFDIGELVFLTKGEAQERRNRL